MVKKKASQMNLDQKRSLISSEDDISIYSQCELLALARSSFYYNPNPESDFNLMIMSRIDEIYTKHPFLGSRRIKMRLQSEGFNIGRDLVVTLMRKMGIEAIYPKPKTTKHSPEHKVYPYLLRGMKIDKPNQVWASDITYIPMLKGFLYLVVVMDWFSRYVLSWRLSNSLNGNFCQVALREALEKEKCDIFNTDQGSQYTSNPFQDMLKGHHILPSMDGRGRAFDNIIVERLWRTVKYEEVYLKAYEDGLDAFENLDKYFLFYNNDRQHQSLEYYTPYEVYHGLR